MKKPRVFVVQLLVEGEDVLDAINHINEGKVEAILPFEKESGEPSNLSDAIGFRQVSGEGEDEDDDEETTGRSRRSRR